MSIRVGAVSMLTAALLVCPQVMTSAEPRDRTVSGRTGEIAQSRQPSSNAQVPVTLAKDKKRVVALTPDSPTSVTNCIPFGNNTDYGFSGMIYRDVPAFKLHRRDKIRFDLGALNAEETRRDIYFASANKNPAPAIVPEDTIDVISQDVRPIRWTKVVSESQLPASSHGDEIVGNYELTYRAEQKFKFKGGGLIIGFASAPPAKFSDPECEQVGVSTVGSDASGNFYARFCFKPHLDLAALDVAGECGGTGIALQGVIIERSKGQHK